MLSESFGNNPISRKKPMTKMFSMIILSGLATIPAAYAQSSQPLRAQIPFTFTVNHQALPAGDYRLTYNPVNHVLAIQSGNEAAMVLARPAREAEASSESPHLTFKCRDKSCYLAQVWQGNGKTNGLQLPQPAQERRLSFEARAVSVTIPAK
jgi:hypothetical protein